MRVIPAIDRRTRGSSSRRLTGTPRAPRRRAPPRPSSAAAGRPPRGTARGGGRRSAARAGRSGRWPARPRRPRPRPRLATASASGTVAGQRRAHLVGRQAQLGDEQDRPQVARRVEPDRLDALVGWRGRHDEAAEQRRRGVVRMALDVARDAPASPAVDSGSPASAFPASTPPTVAAADDPSPRASGMCVVHRDPPADPIGQLATGGPQRRLEALHEPVVAVLGQLVAALALDGQLDLGRGSRRGPRPRSG